MLRVLTFTEGHIGKRKLLICFGVIVVVAIGFLYYESFYNLNNRFRPFSPFANKNTAKSTSDHSSTTKSALNTIDKQTIITQKNEERSKNEVLKDNENNEKKSKCWSTEKFKILEVCTRCDLFALKFVHACQETGYKELIACEKYGHASRSCPTPNHVLSKRYWSFEFICLVLTAIFTSFVFNRKQYLDKQAMDRMRQQILS